jgi:hypothetical protein
MKVYGLLVALLMVCVCVVMVSRVDLRAHLTKCQESVLGSEASTGRCDYPSRIMRVKGVWICSCRSEAETKKGIE